MSAHLTTSHGGKLLTVEVSHKLTAGDYQQFIPEIERLIAEHCRIRLLFDMSDFHGWTLPALWEDLKFGIRHTQDIERLAMVGDQAWEKWMAGFCKPFTSAQVRYFDQSDADEAHDWIAEGMELAVPQPAL